jgi:hypothetical protein
VASAATAVSTASISTATSTGTDLRISATPSSANRSVSSLCVPKRIAKTGTLITSQLTVMRVALSLTRGVCALRVRLLVRLLLRHALRASFSIASRILKSWLLSELQSAEDGWRGWLELGLGERQCFPWSDGGGGDRVEMRYQKCWNEISSQPNDLGLPIVLLCIQCSLPMAI